MKTSFSPLILGMLLLLAACRPDSGDTSTADGKASLAERKLAEGHYTQALQLFEEAMGDEPSNPSFPLWETAAADCMLHTGQRDRALTIASRHVSSGSPLVRSRAFFVKAQAESASSPLSALNSLAAVDLELLDEQRSERAVSLCRTLLKNIPTDNLTVQRSRAWFELYVLLELEQRYAASGEISRAVLYGSEIDRLFPSSRAIYGRPVIDQSTEPSSSWVALLMPLTGSGSDFGVQVHRGAHLAFERHSEMYQNSPRLVDFDTGGDQTQTMNLMESLAGNPSCVAVLGPLTSSVTMAAAPIASRAGLPLLTPTATSGDVDRLGPPVFRLVVSGGDQAAAVAEHAVRHGGHTRFGIIYPYTAQASGEAEQFRAIVESMGGTVVSSRGYQPGSTDFRSEIMAVRAANPQAVFLPVSAWDAVQIAPQLRFYNVNTPLYGTSGWDDEMLLRHGGDPVEGAVFTAAFGLSSMYPETARFVYTFRRRYNAEPTAIAAQAYDAAVMLLDAWKSVTNPTRSRITAKLSSMPPHYGASGRCVLGTETETRHSWPLLMVKDGAIIGID